MLTKVLVIVALFSLASAKFKLSNVLLNVEKEYLNTNMVQLREKDGSYFVSAETEVLKEINGELIVHGNVSIVHPDGQKDVMMQLLPMNFCKFLSGEEKSLILRIAWDQLKPFGTLPEVCPIPVGTYGINNYTPDQGLIPKIIPTGTYRIEADADLTTNDGIKKNIFRVLVDAEVLYDKPQ